MIERVSGNLLEADVEALVNTVNTVGVMGKGIALQFKKAFPDNFKAYKRACESGKLVPGSVFVFETGLLSGPRYIINFPTKRHWKGASRLEDIESGLAALRAEIRARKIDSIALPPLGCGNGGLEWRVVRPLIERDLGAIDGVRVQLFEPNGAPTALRMVDRTHRPKMTVGRAAVLGLMSRYKFPDYDYRLSVLEIQKLAYFLQVAGEPLRLNYQKAFYGPYADELRHVLNRLEGHFIVGFGDGQNKPDTPVDILPDVIDEANSLIASHPQASERFDRVTRLIEGFETPFGMELLSSVHWVTEQENCSDLGSVISKVHDWSERKRTTMQPAHIEAAWTRLREYNWIS